MIMSKKVELIKFEREGRCDLKDRLTGQRILLVLSVPDHHHDDDDDDDADDDVDWPPSDDGDNDGPLNKPTYPPYHFAAC